MVRTLTKSLVSTLVCLALAAPAWAQAQAANGNIEGVVRDASGGVLPGVLVTVINTDTGAQRTATTNDDGVYRALLMPLGAYRVVAELPGFRKYEQTGLALGAGQTLVVDISLSVGGVEESLSVSVQAPVVDTAKIDAGRNLSEREIKNLPLVSRNPYNFALVQPGVSGFENPEFGVPRFSANGTLLRINYQIDGNTNTQKDRAGLRLLPMSEVMIQEVKVVTSGYAPEFGQTTGLVYNAITPSGTNTLKGSASYRFRRKSFSAFPYPFVQPRTDDNKPDTKIDTWTAEAGGPIVRDRVHFFGGFESTYRDLSGSTPVTIRPEDAQRLGLPAQPGALPREQTARFYIGKADWQASMNHRLTGRYIYFENDSPNNVNSTTSGVPNSTEVLTNFVDAMKSASAQLVSTFGGSRLNELRVQFASRHQSRTASELSGTGPQIRIQNVANFGGPNSGTSDAGFDFTQDIWQIIDNFTYVRRNHSYKFGVDLQWVGDERVASLFSLYNFPSIDAYLDARSGANPRAYSTFSQLFGEPGFSMDTGLYSFFVQDDWRLNADLKLLYGVRYDLYDWPDADPTAPFEFSREFKTDANNFGPRLGFAWTPFEDKRTVIRASTGIMYDQPLLVAFENAFQNSGQPARVSVAVNAGSAGAPDFPATLDNLPPGFALPTQSIATIDPDFQVARTFQNNVQIERGLGRDYAVTLGFVYAKGYDLPVLNDINLVNPVGQLGDGRPIFSTAVSASTRLHPEFNHIYSLESTGESSYRAMTLQFTRRWTGNFQFDLSYTLGKGEDTAPVWNPSFLTSFAVNNDDPRSDPTNLERDKGPNLMDTRHNFAGTIVARSKVSTGNRAVDAILSDNQVGVLVQFNSGIPVSIRGNADLNRDGLTNDRPLFVGRNTIYLPARYNVDLRYSRFIPIAGRRQVEVIGEFKNIFDTEQVAGLNTSFPVDAAGNPTVPLLTDGDAFKDAGRVSSGYEQRAFQLGFKFYF
ncbi:MAG TPA: TonB-dependent receptor [Vicinamibacterales bacterium]|nr:TonB-dependent receptor [Vicinamibacterales bacterium]